MRVLPLVSSSTEPSPWVPLGDVELAWDGRLHPEWLGFIRTRGVHALHLPEGLSLDEVGVVLQDGLALGPDFLVLPEGKPEGRRGAFAFLGKVEALLEALGPRGMKLALRPASGAETELARLLKECRGEAVGFCWHGGVVDLAAVEDRLFCATGSAQDDLEPLRRLGYRWNLAVKASDPVAFNQEKTNLEARYPSVLFPAELPTHVMGRPIQPDPEVRLADPTKGRS